MINNAGKRLIRESESCKLTAYTCPAGIPTIGFGNTSSVTAEDVKRKKTITVEMAEAMFVEDIRQFEYEVRKCLTRTPEDNQLAAMVSLAYNIGAAAFAKSTVCKAFNKGDDSAAAQAFGLWNKITVNGQKVVSNGLVARRAKETALYLTPSEDVMATQAQAPASVMPQAVAPPVTLAESKINKSAILTGATGTIGLVTAVVDQLNGFKDSFSKLGDWAMPIICLVVIIGAGWTLYERIKMRNGGVA